MDCSSADFVDLAQEVLGTGACLRFQARGSSMYPAVRDKDTLSVCWSPASDLKKGDVVLCRMDDGRVLVHRIVARKRRPDGDWFFIKGDLCDGPDGWISADRVLGRVLKAERKGREISLYSRKQRLLGRLLASASLLNLGPRFVFIGLYRPLKRGLARTRILSRGVL
jgi:signal peptidase